MNVSTVPEDDEFKITYTLIRLMTMMRRCSDGLEFWKVALMWDLVSSGFRISFARFRS